MRDGIDCEKLVDARLLEERGATHQRQDLPAEAQRLLACGLRVADCGGAAHARCERRRLVSEVDGHEKWKRPPAWPANSERWGAAALARRWV